MVINNTLFQLATETDPDRQLTALQYRVWTVIISTADDSGSVRITTSQMAELVGSTQPNASRALNKLTALGLVDKIENGLYRLTEKTARSRAEAKRIKDEVNRQIEAKRKAFHVVSA